MNSQNALLSKLSFTIDVGLFAQLLIPSLPTKFFNFGAYLKILTGIHLLKAQNCAVQIYDTFFLNY